MSTVHLLSRQAKTDEKYQIEMWESTPYVEIFLQATVPVACPGCSATLRLEKHVGLTVSSCSVTFSASDPPLTNHSLRVRSVQTPGTNSRIVKLQFAALSANASLMTWDGYELPELFVSLLRIVEEVTCKHFTSLHFIL